MPRGSPLSARASLFAVYVGWVLFRRSASPGRLTSCTRNKMRLLACMGNRRRRSTECQLALIERRDWPGRDYNQNALDLFGHPPPLPPLLLLPQNKIDIRNPPPMSRPSTCLPCRSVPPPLGSMSVSKSHRNVGTGPAKWSVHFPALFHLFPPLPTIVRPEMRRWTSTLQPMRQDEQILLVHLRPPTISKTRHLGLAKG